MLMKLVAKKVCRRFSGSMTGFYGFFSVGLQLLFSLNGPQREKSVNFYASYPLKNCRELKTDCGLTQSKSVN